MGLISSLEHRQRTPLDDYWYGPVYRPTGAGVDVGPDEVMASSSVWNAFWNVAITVATIPLKLFRRGENQGREPAREHPLYRVLYDRPNRWMPAVRYRSMAQFHLLMYGNHYAQQLRDRAGRTRELIPLHAARMRVEMDGDEILYTYYRPTGGDRVFKQDEILHITGLSANGLLGLNPLEVNRETFGTTIAVERHAAAYYGNRAQPGLVLKSPKRLGKEGRKNLREAMYEAYGGEKAFSTAVLEDGVEPTPFGTTARDAEMLANRTFQVGEVARILNVPPHILKELTRATFSNIEQQSLEYIIHTLRPWFVAWEQSIGFYLLPEENPEDLYAKFVVDELLRGDSEARGRFYNQLFMIGAASPNDIRRWEDLPPIDGGDRYFVQINMQPLDVVDEILLPGEEPGTPGDDPGPPLPVAGAVGGGGRLLPPSTGPELRAVQERSIQARARTRGVFHPLIRRAVNRFVQREVRAARRALEGSRKRADLGGFRRWMDQFYAALPKEVRRIMGPVFASYAAEIRAAVVDELGEEADDVAVEAFVAAYVNRYGLRYSRVSAARLRQALEQDDPDAAAQDIERILDGWEASRADTEAGWETVRADGAIAVAIYTASRLAMRWYALGKSCPFCSQLDGTIVSAGSSFLEAGATLEGGADQDPLHITSTVRHAPVHGGCDCFVVAA